MNEMEWLARQIASGAFTAAILLGIWKILGPFFSGYLKKKAEDLATKEDIALITEKVESVKAGFATSIERLKWDLGKKATLHHLYAAKQLEALAEIWDALFELQRSTEALRQSSEQEGEAEQRYDRYKSSHTDWESRYNSFFQVLEKRKLFLDPELYMNLWAIRSLSFLEAMGSSADTAMAGKGGAERDYESDRQNIRDILELIESAYREIRKRFE